MNAGKIVLAGLNALEIETGADKTFKETAKKYSLIPSEVYTKIRESYKN